MITPHNYSSIYQNTAAVSHTELELSVNTSIPINASKRVVNRIYLT